jgi:hypothetical protein
MISLRSSRGRFVTRAEFDEIRALILQLSGSAMVKPDGVGKIFIDNYSTILDLTLIAVRVDDLERRLKKATVVCNEDGTITLTI